MIKSASRSSITNDQKYRSMLAGAVPSNEYLIESRILDTAVSSVVFDNLAQYAGTYKHLQIVFSAKSTFTTYDNSSLYVYLNGDTGSGYRGHYLFNSSTTVISGTDAGVAPLGVISSSRSDVPNRFGAGIIDILDAYSTTKNKTMRSLTGTIGTDSPYIMLLSGARFNTESISTIELRSNTNNLAIGSRFSLYGVTA